MVKDDGRRAVPVLHVVDVRRSLLEFRTMGFTAQIEEHGLYGFLRRGDARIHVRSRDDAGEFRCSECYLYVENADAVAAEWAELDIAGRVVAPEDKPWGMREGEYRDPDGNLIRFGHRLPWT